MFEKDFLDFIQLLNIHNVEYMIVGAHALAFHGRPRYTGDLDIWIKPSANNAKKMIAVLKDFGFGSLNFKEEDFLKENYVTQLGYPPLRVDILNDISGVNFDEAYLKRTIGEYESLLIPFISIDDFIKNKEATGRIKDAADIDAIKKPKKK